MQVRPGNQTAAAREAQAVSAGNPLPQRHVYARHVGVTGLVTEAVVHLHVNSVAGPVPRHLHHHAVSGGVDGIARRAGEVHARMPPAIAQDGMDAVAEGAGKPVSGRIRIERRNGRDVGGHVTGRPLQDGHVVKGFGLDVHALFQLVQTADNALHGRSLQLRIAVGATQARIPDSLGNLIQTIYGTVYAVVPFFQHHQEFLVAVQLLGHQVYPGVPFRIPTAQDGRFGKVLPGSSHLQPHEQEE